MTSTLRLGKSWHLLESGMQDLGDFQTLPMRPINGSYVFFLQINSALIMLGVYEDGHFYNQKLTKGKLELTRVDDVQYWKSL